ncbi:MAG: family peptidase [Proteobacteria bacterium]|nr:family peptidase [Pseudomonadota bacterium]
MVIRQKITLLLAAMLLSACQQISTTQGGAIGADRRQNMSMLLSEQQVQEMAGKAYAEETGKARHKGALNTNPAVTARVRGIANRLIPQVAIFRVDAARWNWEVNVENSPDINAYCMAGGKIMVFSGLIEKLKLTDDELAQIMGHEISHALREHTRERMSEAYTRMMGFTLLSVVTGGRYAGALDLANQVTEVAYTLPNSREHESEADIMGLELAARAGYHPNAAITLWQKMAKASEGKTPEFLSTHPSHSTRISELQARIPQVMPLYQEAIKRYPAPSKLRN